MWDVTNISPELRELYRISTHTSRVGCDIDETVGTISTHTSRVGCDVIRVSPFCFRSRFLLTHPVWDVTPLNLSFTPRLIFLLTHPVWDVTVVPSSAAFVRQSFLLTHPVWDVTVCMIWQHRRLRFLLTHPVWDVTNNPRTTSRAVKNFYSHIPCGM